MILFPFQRWGNWGTVRLRKLSQSSKLLSRDVTEKSGSGTAQLNRQLQLSLHLPTLTTSPLWVSGDPHFVRYFPSWQRPYPTCRGSPIVPERRWLLVIFPSSHWKPLSVRCPPKLHVPISGDLCHWSVLLPFEYFPCGLMHLVKTRLFLNIILSLSGLQGETLVQVKS